jgi:hypothetical protein
MNLYGRIMALLFILFGAVVSVIFQDNTYVLACGFISVCTWLADIERNL